MTTALGELPYFTVVALVAIGLYIVLVKKNLIKVAMGIVLMEAGANLFLITLAFNSQYSFCGVNPAQGSC